MQNIYSPSPSPFQSLLVAGGLHHHLANSGNLGQFFRKNYPVAVANNLNAKSVQQVDVVGPLCTPLDIVAKGVMLPICKVGDWLAIFQSGAYGLSASPTGFLGHPVASEILI